MSDTMSTGKAPEQARNPFRIDITGDDTDQETCLKVQLAHAALTSRYEASEAGTPVDVGPVILSVRDRTIPDDAATLFHRLVRLGRRVDVFVLVQANVNAA